MNLGNSQLPCPESPNCVSSHSQDKDHYIEPLAYKGTQKNAFKQLITIIHNYPRTNIVTETEDYLHVECKSAWFGFVDDLEFFFTPTQEIHIRSAARVGYSDFGVNRKRIAVMRAQFEKL
ncbi:MAG: DUF1499 domain-containing protein [Thiomargarita sp.]|nr:DUF1499 domain-containing protein [Thiomargarita sp.]